MSQPISRFMSGPVFTVGLHASLADARTLMETHGVRHLPVLDGGQLVGMLSSRDIQVVEAMAAGKLAEVDVEEAMSQDVLTVEPEASAAEVAGAMAEHKYGSAVVRRDRTLLGIFTTVDACRALREVLTA